MPDLPWSGRRLTRRHPSLQGAARLHLRPGREIGVAFESVKRGSLGVYAEGKASDLNRLGQEDVDRIRQANAPACLDGCGVGLDLSGVVPGSYAHHELCCRG